MVAQLHLRLIGPFAVSRSGLDVPASQAGSRKARQLLAFLAVERGRLVSLDRIVRALWGDSPPRRPSDSVATLVSRLRASLGQGVVAGDRAGYRLGAGVGVDLYEAAVAIGHAGVSADLQVFVKTVRRALAVLDAASVLEDEPGAAWAEPARVLHANVLRRARHVVAEASLRSGEAGAALEVAEAAIAADPFDELAYRLVMRAWAARGEPGRALAAYERLSRTLAETLGVDPSAATRDLRAEILQPRVYAVSGPG